MNILIIGDDVNFQEAKLKFGHSHTYTFLNEHRDADNFLPNYDLVLDFIIDEEPDEIEMYATRSATVLLNTCKISLGELAFMVDNKLKSKIFGFNGMPTFLNRELLEVSVWRKEDEEELKKICEALQTKYQLVDDRVGLVTPRVICMIINEAYYTTQEGTALREDIDMAMKMGTNYPYGPFEWCERIGIKHVYELLEAVYEDTKDERYKICPLLKKEYLRK